MRQLSSLLKNKLKTGLRLLKIFQMKWTFKSQDWSIISTLRGKEEERRISCFHCQFLSRKPFNGKQKIPVGGHGDWFCFFFSVLKFIGCNQGNCLFLVCDNYFYFCILQPCTIAYYATFWQKYALQCFICSKSFAFTFFFFLEIFQMFVSNCMTWKPVCRFTYLAKCSCCASFIFPHTSLPIWNTTCPFILYI